MTKHTVTRTWLAGFVVFVVGLIVGIVSLVLIFAFGGHYSPAPTGNGYDFEPVLDAFFWTMLGLTITGFICVLAGGIVQLVAWVGALTNTYQLQDKTWFAVLLGGGLLGLAFGLIGMATMLAYVIAGPDGTAVRQTQMGEPERWPHTAAPTS